MSGLLAGDRAEVLYALSFLLLGAGTALAVAALRRRSLDVLAVALAAAGATGWLLSNGVGEGAVLFEVLQGNGLTVADLLAVPALVLVVVLSWRRLTEPR